MEKEMICIVCFVGCYISVNIEIYEVKGNFCLRGEVYGKEELIVLKRVVILIVKIKNVLDKRCLVKIEKLILKELNFKLMDELKNIELIVFVKRGDIVIKNVFNIGVDVVVIKDM